MFVERDFRVIGEGIPTMKSPFAFLTDREYEELYPRIIKWIGENEKNYRTVFGLETATEQYARELKIELWECPECEKLNLNRVRCECQTLQTTRKNEPVKLLGFN